MATMNDCWTPVFARSTKKTKAAGKTPGNKTATNLIKTYQGVAASPSHQPSTKRRLDPEDFPALPKRCLESTVKREKARCWNRIRNESKKTVDKERSKCLSKDEMYPCLVDTVNAVLAKEDDIPKAPDPIEPSSSIESLLSRSQSAIINSGEVHTEMFEVVPGLSFTYSTEGSGSGSNFLERNAYRLFLGDRNFRKRNRSRYTFCQ